MADLQRFDPQPKAFKHWMEIARATAASVISLDVSLIIGEGIIYIYE